MIGIGTIINSVSIVIAVMTSSMGKEIRVANMLPAVILAILAAYLPF